MPNRYFLACSLLLLSVVFWPNTIQAQTKNTHIEYEQYENGKLQPDRTISLITDGSLSSIVNSSTPELFYIDYKNRKTIKTGVLAGKSFAVITSFDSLPKMTSTAETDTILGFACRKMKCELFSNRIELWVSDQVGINASPSISFIPEKGLVLKYSVNGSRMVVAKTLEATHQQITLPGNEFLKVNESQYAAAQIKSRYTSIKIFDHEKINFEDLETDKVIKHLELNYRFSKGNIILKTIPLPKDAAKGNWFLKLTEWSNGDAYDRVGSVFMIPAQKEKSIYTGIISGKVQLPIDSDRKGEKYQGIISQDDYAPAIELMRFFTPFGVGAFNKKRIIDGYPWADSAVYKQDITALIPSNQNEITVGVYIGNYDKGGHKLSLELDFYPDKEMPAAEKYIQPLFNTVNILEAEGQNYGKLFDTDTLKVEFTIPDSLQNMSLLFTTTGHGGWENGDEFVPKLNQVYLDGKEIFHITPWRTDCGTYRLLNPASGNFPDGLSSSDLSRSNWCPGTLTPPFIVPIAALGKGKHTLQVAINQGKPEGGSFSHWCVSGVLTATYHK